MRTRFLLSFALTACSSNYQSVCAEIGLCESQTSTQIGSCESEAGELADEAFDAGCTGPFNVYFDCANGAYACNGDTVTFPGCQSSLNSLDQCLGNERELTSCTALADALAACPDDGDIDGGFFPSPCGAREDCAAACYLNGVATPCAPTAAELANVETCTGVCP